MSKLDSTQGPSIKRVFCPSGVSFEAVNVIQRDTVIFQRQESPILVQNQRRENI